MDVALRALDVRVQILKHACALLKPHTRRIGLHFVVVRVILLIAVVRHELCRRLARCKLCHEDQHLAIAEASVYEIECVIHARARVRRGRFDLYDLFLISGLDRLESGLALHRLLKHTLGNELLEHPNHKPLAADIAV